MERFQLLDKLKRFFNNDSHLLDVLVRALSDYQMEDIYNFVSRCYDLSIIEQEEEQN